MPKKKRMLKKSVRLIIFLLTLILLFFLGEKICGYQIRTITVLNNQTLKEQEILEKTDLLTYPNIFKVSRKKIINQLKQIDRIKDVTVKKKWFFEIEINVTEYERLWIVQETNQVLLENGKEVPLKEKVDTTLPTLINYVPNTKYEKLQQKWLKIDKKVRNKISEIKYDPNNFDEDRFLLYMNDQNSVYITLTKIDILNRYNDILRKLDGKKGILYLDSGNYFEIKN